MRASLSKKIRFEVFKRDKFTCQYCGEKSPNVILNVDHIEAVANGGSNDILNLITSCFECNNGKRAIPLSDDSVVEKQRRQMEELQERREQIELMFEWKKSLSELDNEVNTMIASYIDSKMNPWSVTENFKATIQSWLKKFELQDVLDAIDISANKYLYFEDSKATNDSAENFLDKIGGILHNKRLSPLQQKMGYIRGIARNRFSYWDDRKGAIILSNYVQALKKHWTDEQILDDLTKEVEVETKNADNWSRWRKIIEGWTDDINEKWGNPEEEVNQENEPLDFQNGLLQKDYTDDQLIQFVYHTNCEQVDHIKALEHIAILYPDYEKNSFEKELQKELFRFLKNANDFDHPLGNDDELNSFIQKYIDTTFLVKVFSDYYNHENCNFGVLMALERPVYDLLISIFKYYYFPNNLMKRKYAEKLLALHIEDLSKQLEQDVH